MWGRKQRELLGATFELLLVLVVKYLATSETSTKEKPERGSTELVVSDIMYYVELSKQVTMFLTALTFHQDNV